MPLYSLFYLRFGIFPDALIPSFLLVLVSFDVYFRQV